MSFTRKDLLGIEELSAGEIQSLLVAAVSFKEIIERNVKKVPTLRGKTIINLFLEPSTRTRISFELAGKYLSADVINISAGGSSVSKGESLLDTAKTLEAMKADYLVVRTPFAGAPLYLAKMVKSAVINAGDGAHEHPTQALLDLFTIQEKFQQIRSLKVAIIGDISHSRVARSNIWGLLKLGAEVTLIAPPTLLPIDIEKMGVKVRFKIDDELKKADLVYVLRLQRERQRGGLLPGLREYARLYGINSSRISKKAMVMHPGPLNQGIEIDDELAYGPRSLVTDQVTNGLAVRMAVLYLLVGKK